MVEYSTIEPWQTVDEHGVIYELNSLYDYFEQLPDPRKARGKRYPQVTLLVLIFLAKLSGADRPSAIAAWCQARTKALVALLHLSYPQMPHHNTIRRLLAWLDPDVFEQAMQRFGQQQRAGQPDSHLLALDGKKERGTMPAGESQGEETMALYAPEQQEVIAQVVVDASEGEIPSAQKLLKGQRLTGKVVLADAMHTQRKLSEQIKVAQADFLFTVKDNQPTVLDHIQTLFTTPDPDRADLDFQTSRTINKGHGRIEERTLIASDLLNGYLDWPHLAQVFQLTRKFTFLRKGQVVRVEQKVHYGLTSLSRQKASAADLLAMKRAYWQIETGLHYRRDVTFHEDATRMSQPKAAHNLTIIHNTILSLFARLGCRNASLTRFRLDGDLGLAFSLLTSAHPRL
jgi:predicted transposase YbfD/YdcC